MPVGKKPKTVTLAREERLAKVADMDARGMTTRMIAARLGVSDSQITDDLKLVYGRYQESALANTAAKVERACVALNQVRAEAWDAWVRSCEDAVTVTQEKAAAPPGRDEDDDPPPPGKRGRKPPWGKPKTPELKDMLRVIKETTRREGQAGDPRFLSIIKETIAEEARLRGLYPDAKAGRVTVEGGADFWDKFLDAFAAPAPQPPDPIEEAIARAALPVSVETIDGKPDERTEQGRGDGDTGGP